MATARTLHIEIRQSPADHRVSILRGHNSRWFSRYSSRRQPMKKIARHDCAAALLLMFGVAWRSPHALAQSTPTRYEQTDASVTYTIGWSQDSSRSWSAGTAAVSTTPGAQATFTFSGPSVNWIGGRGPWSGIARVSVDGAFVAEVDTYSKTEEIRVPMFTVNSLTNASHTLTIGVTGVGQTVYREHRHPDLFRLRIRIDLGHKGAIHGHAGDAGPRPAAADPVDRGPAEGERGLRAGRGRNGGASGAP